MSGAEGARSNYEFRRAQEVNVVKLLGKWVNSEAIQLFIEFKHMSSEGTSDMLSPARNLPSVCLENIENPCFKPSKA